MPKLNVGIVVIGNYSLGLARKADAWLVVSDAQRQDHS